MSEPASQRPKNDSLPQVPGTTPQPPWPSSSWFSLQAHVYWSGRFGSAHSGWLLAGQSDATDSHLPSIAFGAPSKPASHLQALSAASHELLSGQPLSTVTHWLESALGL